MIILDTGGNTPGFKLQKSDGTAAYITFDGSVVSQNVSLDLQGNQLKQVSQLGIINSDSGNSTFLSYVNQSYNSGEQYLELAYNDVPFLYKNELNMIGMPT